MNTKQEKIKHLKSFKKETEIHDLLDELLPKMGFDDVLITHERGSRPEDGKDVICSKLDEIEGKKDWIAFVVKKGKIVGTSAAINEVENQAIDCFKYEYKTIVKTEQIRISKVKVVTNAHFTSGAKDKILRNEKLQRVNIDFWDGEKIVGFIDKFHSRFWLRGSETYKEYIERFEERIKTDNLSRSIGIENNKVKKLLTCLIEPQIMERVLNPEGDYKWKERHVNTIVNLDNNSIIVGEPGAGKTTFFKQLAKEVIAQNSLRNNVDFYPILISFTALKKSDFSLEKTLVNYFERDWNKDLSVDIQNLIDNKKCCIFIDALDELAVNEDKEKALKAINEFHAKFNDIKIICSSRHSDYLYYNCDEVGFNYLQISPLRRQQVEAFIDSYFGGDLLKSKRLLKSLRDTGILEKLPKTPLTIALITILFDENEVEIPATITDLYTSFIDLLLGKYKPENTIEILEIGAKHRILCHIAKELHVRDLKFTTEDVVLNWIKTYADERGQEFDYGRIIDNVIENTGLLTKNSRQEIQFKHLSFQEYFTAYEIFHHRQGDREKIVNNFNNLWWQNVAIFYAGMSKDSPDLIDEIIENNKPETFIDYMVNAAGFGRLLQALYNTPINKRKLGLSQSTKSVVKALDLVLRGEDGSKEVEFWRYFSKYGLMQLMSGFFAYNHWSITLTEPMKQLFSEEIASVDDTVSLLDDFKLFLIALTLASQDTPSYSEMRKIVERSSWTDVSFLALIDDYLSYLRKRDKTIFKKNEDLKYLEKKIRQRLGKLGDISEKVNSPINKKEVIKRIREKSET